MVAGDAYAYPATVIRLMMWKKHCLTACLALCVLPTAWSQQNLVPDPSFEEIGRCQVISGWAQFLWDATHWFPAFPPTGGAIAHLVHPCIGSNAIDERIRIRGSQQPRTGISMGGLPMDFRPDVTSSYACVELLSRLVRDSVYVVSYYVNYSDSSDLACSNCLTAAFFEKLVLDTLAPMPFALYPDSVVNQFSSPDSPILKDTVNWMQICDTIRATGQERYLVIGNTLDFSTAILERTSPPDRGLQTFYYLDDVSVRKIPGGTASRHHRPAVCPDSLPLRLRARAGFQRYRWSTGDTSASLSVSAAGRYWVEQDYGCGVVRDTFTVAVAPPYQAPPGQLAMSLGQDTLICASELPLRLSGRVGFQRYRWSTGDTTLSTEVFSAGSYRLHYDEGYAAGCGQLVDTFQVAVEAQGPVIDLGPDTINCRDDRQQAVRLDAGPGQPGYRWSTGDTTQTITVQDTQLYWVAAAHRVCQDRSDSVRLRGCAPLRVIIELPTVFTPNADDRNDRWQGRYANFAFGRLTVYDRWGRLVFEATDPQQAWDGTRRGQPQGAGVYFYVLAGQVGGEPVQRRGTVTLLR